MSRVLDEEFLLFRKVVDRYCTDLERLPKHGSASKRASSKAVIPTKTIDLHGKTTSEARQIFDEMVVRRSSMRSDFLRFIIITGKGSKETPSVLKDTVERYFMTVKNSELKKMKDAFGEIGSYILEIYPL